MFKIMSLSILALVLLAIPCHAATINASSCAQSAVQTAINSAHIGDTVQVPGGSASWSGLALPAGIYLNINGCTVSGQNALNISTNGVNAPRVYNGNFSSGDQTTFINVYGECPALIDHNTFVGGAASEMIHNLADGASSTAGWANSVTPGGSCMIFVEDNTFTFLASGNPAYFWGSSAMQSYYGARTVFRHNICNMCQIDQHGTPGAIGARWWEIYENTFNTITNANQSDYIVLRGGSGVVFNNHQNGPNGGAGNIRLYEEDSGYPALYQVGRGQNQSLFPAYVWGNASSMHVGSGSSNVVQGRDFFVTAPTYSYTSYTYPHPLVSGGGGGTPPPPNTVSVSFTVTPSNFSFTATASSSFCLSDTSPGNPTYTLVSDSKWLSATVSTIVVNGCGFRIPINVNTTGLAPGTYKGNITVTIPDQTEGTSTTYHWTTSPLKVPVTLTVSGAPPPPQGMTTICSFTSSTVWACNSTLQNIPSGQAIKSVTTTGTITNTTNGVKP